MNSLRSWRSPPPRNCAAPLTSGTFYKTVWNTDNGIISAGFGLARTQSADGQRDEAVTTLDQVPPTSRHFTTARLTSAVTLLSGRSGGEITEQQIRDAARRVEVLPDTEPRVLQIRALVLGTAMDWLTDNTASTNHILGLPLHRTWSAPWRRVLVAGTLPRRADAGTPLCAGRSGHSVRPMSTF